jgi:hypothetical protein
LTVWCVTGLDSPDWAANVRENFARQRDVAAELVVVENGAGIGVWGEGALRSGPGVTDYINTGLGYVRRYSKPGDVLAKFDSDDYYGPEYLSRVVRALGSRRVACAACSIYVRTPDDRLLSVAFPVPAGDRIEDRAPCHGPTLACWVSDAVDFPEVKEGWGEDSRWVEAMRASSVEFVALPLGQFAYQRTTTRYHAFPVTDDIRHVWSRATVHDLGPWDPRIVDGTSEPSQRVEVPFEPEKMAAIGAQLMDRFLGVER